MKKLVNGVEVDMNQAEIDEYNARQTAWENSKLDRMTGLFGEALQSHIDFKAKEKNYENGYACASYANSSNATWKQEALDFIAWRDACWQYAIGILAQVEAQEIEPPTMESFINNAPVLNW